MGEIADMMLDGTLCEGCGVYLEGEPTGYPRYCSGACASGRGATVPSGNIGGHDDPYVTPSGPKKRKRKK